MYLIEANDYMQINNIEIINTSSSSASFSHFHVGSMYVTSCLHTARSLICSLDSPFSVKSTFTEITSTNNNFTFNLRMVGDRCVQHTGQLKYIFNLFYKNQESEQHKVLEQQIIQTFSSGYSSVFHAGSR